LVFKKWVDGGDLDGISEDEVGRPLHTYKPKAENREEYN
jgi:hypothetical protein